MRRILLICTGNTCRSPMAGTILQQRLDERARGEYEVCTAGLAAFDGDRASRYARLALKERGLDLDKHRSSRINMELVEASDLILAMTSWHCRSLMEQYPEARLRTFTVGEYIGDSSIEIPDPVGGSLDTYRQCMVQLEHLMRQVSDQLIEQFGSIA